MIHQTDICAPPECLEFYKTAEYAVELDQLIVTNRQKLDTDGLGDRFMAMYRAKESEKGFYDSKYRVILAAAIMMRCGAKIKDDDLQHVRSLFPQIPCREGYAEPIDDDGFRGPGKRQFLAALDNYKPGVARSFGEPSCFACGKIECDIGKKLDKCARCCMAWYCNKDCQKAHWKDHKPVCKDPRSTCSLNV